MILADCTVIAAALRGNLPNLTALFTDLRQRGGVTAPAQVFARLLVDAPDDRTADAIRKLADELPRLDGSLHAWLAAGDLCQLLHEHGLTLELLDAHLVAIALREDWPLWTFNPAFEELGRVVPLKRFQPRSL